MLAKPDQMLQPKPYPRLLSLVLPMYNEIAVVKHLRTALSDFVRQLGCDIEIILVNDGSVDGTLQAVVSWAREDDRVQVINLSRNFGHQAAATAGLDHAEGDAVILLDADLQDPLETIHRMIELYCEGYDVVFGQRIARQGETLFKRFTAWLFYRLMSSLIYKGLPVDAGDFRLISRKCLSGLQQMRETHRFLRGMVAWVGYPQIGVPYIRGARVAGNTKYPIRKMLKFAWTAATSFSALPLKASVIVGLLAMLLGIEEALRATVAYLLNWYVVPGWASLTVLISLLGGATLMSIGILGEYVAKVYEQVKNRPLYLVTDTYHFRTSKCEQHQFPVAQGHHQ